MTVKGSPEKESTAGPERVRQFFHIEDILCLPLLLYTMYFLTELVVHTLSDAGIPNEYREAANVLLTDVLSGGKDPYRLSVLKEALPCFIYLYGPLYSCVCAVFAAILPVDIVMVHYGVTFVCILASGFFAAKTVRAHSRSFIAPLCAFLFLMVCHWRYGFVNAVPDSMALMLLTAVIYVLSLEEFKYKAAVCAALTIALFFTKQYFLLVAGSVFIYLIIYDRRTAFRYVRDCFILGAASVAVITIFCPLFWTFTIYLAKGPGAGIAGHVTKNGVKVSSNDYNLQQIMSVGGLFLFFFVAQTVGTIVAFFKKRLTRTDILMLIHLAVSGVCLVFYLGKNGGAWLSYYLELFIPALIMGALLHLEKLSSAYLSTEKGDKRRKFYIMAILAAYLITAGFTILRVEQRLPKTPMNDEDYAAWEKAERLVDDNAEGEEYLYPLLAYYGLENNEYIYNSGQPFVVSEKFYNKYLESGSAQRVFPYAGDIFRQHLDYRKEIVRKVREGEYSLVTFIPDYEADIVFTEEDLKENYCLADTLTLRTGRQLWDVQFWTLK